MKRYALLSLALAGSSLIGACPAHAGPWTLPQGTGRIIATIIYSHAPTQFGDDGNVRSAPSYDQYQAYLLTEYGVTDDLTVFATPSFKRVKVENAGDSTGLGYTEVGARYRVVDAGSIVVSVQGSAFIPGVRRRDVVAQIGSTEPQYDARVQVGSGFKLGKTNLFASMEGSYRYRAGAQPNEFHADFTVGVHATERLMLIANSFNTWSDGAGRAPFPRSRYDNLYAGGVYKLNDKLSLQAGVLATTSGRNALRERGFYTGLWLHF